MSSRGPEGDTPARGRRESWRTALDRRARTYLPILFADGSPLDLRILGRMLWRAALVGAAAGIIGAAFFAAAEYLQWLLLDRLAGYSVLRAHGETFAAGETAESFRPWLLCLLPAVGGLVCGLLTRRVPEARGGGGDTMMEAFHLRGGAIRRRVIPIKLAASVAVLGTGGAGGREGPTMLVGGAVGSLVGRLLHVSARERRILLIAGVAAGISAVFRTPLGAALLAVEILYKDGFESDALVPSVLASVVAYSIVISIFGESTLFGHAAGFPFVAAHLPLYALLALVLSAWAAGFLRVLRAVQRAAAALPGPVWMRPALGGLALGLLATPIIMWVGDRVGAAGQGLGILGGGYGAAQTAITGASWLPAGWNAVGLLCLLAAAKMIASSLTIGSGGSAGDFAPSLAIGALLGGAFGRAAELVVGDPRIDAGAFALVGMGVFYGGIAHVPLAALVLVCELAGNYDLLVPLMLALAISFVALRKQVLYPAQVASARESPAHRDALLLEALQAIRVAELVARGGSHISFAPATPASEMLVKAGDVASQDVFPVLDGAGQLRGLVTAESLRVLAADREGTVWVVAADLMTPPVTVTPSDDLRCAAERLLAHGLREIPVVGPDGQIVGFVDEAEIARVYLKAAARAEAASLSGAFTAVSAVETPEAPVKRGAE
jgi:chloride channel protein, CIC family